MTMQTQRAALSEARRKRAEHLIALAEGTLSPLDLVEHACTDDGRPLRKITLLQLHLNTKDWGRRRTERLLEQLAFRLELPVEEVRNQHVGWLIDPRSGGRRFLAWLDVQHEKKGFPWPGFPFTPRL